MTCSRERLGLGSSLLVLDVHALSPAAGCSPAPAGRPALPGRRCRQVVWAAGAAGWVGGSQGPVAVLLNARGAVCGCIVVS
jgi:hypothetical protein